MCYGCVVANEKVCGEIEEIVKDAAEVSALALQELIGKAYDVGFDNGFDYATSEANDIATKAEYEAGYNVGFSEGANGALAAAEAQTTGFFATNSQESDDPFGDQDSDDLTAGEVFYIVPFEATVPVVTVEEALDAVLWQETLTDLRLATLEEQLGLKFVGHEQALQNLESQADSLTLYEDDGVNDFQFSEQ